MFSQFVCAVGHQNILLEIWKNITCELLYTL